VALATIHAQERSLPWQEATTALWPSIRYVIYIPFDGAAERTNGADDLNLEAGINEQSFVACRKSRQF
jgi:hypothetical protein